MHLSRTASVLAVETKPTNNLQFSNHPFEPVLVQRSPQQACSRHHRPWPPWSWYLVAYPKQACYASFKNGKRISRRNQTNQQLVQFSNHPFKPVLVQRSPQQACSRHHRYIVNALYQLTLATSQAQVAFDNQINFDTFGPRSLSSIYLERLVQQAALGPWRACKRCKHA
mmetsp:Transcript_28213/g.45383  ORF Transcript_28213/g.45383 Transcript_28213/m.45383 type:complete len:169 (-) Transcript_28213:1696-2202(-)